MIRTIKYHYRQIHGIKKFLMGLAFFVAAFITTFRFLYADTLPFENDLTSIFSWMDTWYYSNTYFKFGGNDFVGIIFRQDIETGHNETITINSGAQAITCTDKLRGIYYNNQRGRTIRPLDTGNLQALQTSPYATGYGDMSMQYGFYTNCSTLSGSYTPNPYDIYGQINHYLTGGQTFSMIAGVNYDFTGNAIITWTTFAHTLSILSGLHNGYIFDNEGWIAELSMNLPRCSSFNMGPSSLPQGTTATFICQGNSVNGYALSIMDSGMNEVYYSATGSIASSQRRFTGQALAPGNYTAQCVLLFSGGGIGGAPCEPNLSFTVTSSWGSTPPSGTGCDPDFQGEISFSALSSGQFVINPLLGTYYTNKTGIVIQYAATKPNLTVISGDFVTSPIHSTYTGSNIFVDISMKDISLLSMNARNNFSGTFTVTTSWGSCTYSDSSKRVFVDTLPPTAPAISTPTSGTYLCSSTPLNVAWSVAYDTGSRVSYYAYEIATNTGMTNIILSGSVPYSTLSTSLNISLLPVGTYYLRIAAVDLVGLKSYSTPIMFTTSPSYCPVGTGIMIVSPVISITNADLDTVYKSDPIYVLGLTWPTLFSISKGMLFINNGTGVGMTGMVTSHDTIYIEMISSKDYDETVTSNLSIMGRTWAFTITTKESDCHLSTAEKLIIQNIYADLKDEYNNDISKYSEFLNTFQSMVEDESDLTSSCTLDYLLQLIEDDFDTEGIDTSNHITPNCKEYTIGYDIDEGAYYSPDMMNRYYFVNRESLIRHLDYYNPGDCHINTYGNNYRSSSEDPMLHIAPNGKIYHLVGQYGGYSAEEFMTTKYFDSLQGITSYIDLRNPAKEIRRHTIDDSFLPIVYAAPNGKEYKIYKTDRWYMSYKLLKVRYFSSLSELKSYIDKNNPSKR